VIRRPTTCNGACSVKLTGKSLTCKCNWQLGVENDSSIRYDHSFVYICGLIDLLVYDNSRFKLCLRVINWLATVCVWVVAQADASIHQRVMQKWCCRCCVIRITGDRYAILNEVRTHSGVQFVSFDVGLLLHGNGAAERMCRLFGHWTFHIADRSQFGRCQDA
jgi:hypothetical protein